MTAVRLNGRARITLLLATLGTVTLLGLSTSLGAPKGADTEKDRNLERARREVKLLDDIYKTAIVLITQHYVDEDSDLPAGEAFKVLFAGMKEKGWHEVRLLDATGEPLNDENKPQDKFEKSAIAALLDGKPYYEELIDKDGKEYLRAATPIPIVMDKCIMCHGNYREQKVIGALGYTLPLEPELKETSPK